MTLGLLGHLERRAPASQRLEDRRHLDQRVCRRCAGSTRTGAPVVRIESGRRPSRPPRRSRPCGLRSRRVAAALVDDEVAAHLVLVLLAEQARRRRPKPPASSSAGRQLELADSGRQPSSARSSAAAASAATWDFMSSAPRPRRSRRADRPDQGSTGSRRGSASTVSTWPISQRGAVASPRQTGDQVRPSFDPERSSHSGTGALQQAAKPLLRGLLVARGIDRSTWINRCSSSVVRRSSSSLSGTVASIGRRMTRYGQEWQAAEHVA